MSCAYRPQSTLLTCSITDTAGVFINYLNDVVATRAYSRKLEMEADSVGLQLMATAGYDPRGALDLWELFSCMERDLEASGHGVSVENKLALLRTHPTSEDRYRALDKEMPAAMKLWEEQRARAAGRRLAQAANKESAKKEEALGKSTVSAA